MFVYISKRTRISGTMMVVVVAGCLPDNYSTVAVHVMILTCLLAIAHHCIKIKAIGITCTNTFMQSSQCRITVNVFLSFSFFLSIYTYPQTYTERAFMPLFSISVLIKLKMYLIKMQHRTFYIFFCCFYTEPCISRIYIALNFIKIHLF